MITVEDVNSTFLNHINGFYELDTGNISSDVYNNVLYDFCICNHSVNGNNHVFSFEIINNDWTGGYYFVKNNGDLLNDTVNFNDGVITITTTEDSVKLILYLCSFNNSFEFKRLSYKFESLNPIIITKDMINTSSEDLTLINLETNVSETVNITLNTGVVSLPSPYNYFKILVLLEKTDVIFNMDTVVTVGIVNKIRLNVNDAYLPDGDLVSDELLDIVVQYNGLSIPIYYDTGFEDYCFDLDLTDKIDDKNIKLTVIVNETDLVNDNQINIALGCVYPQADTFNELQSKIVEGAEIIELTETISFDNNLTIPHDLYLICKDNIIELNSNRLIIMENTTLKINDGNFNRGISCFIQNENSKLVLNNCDFTDCIIEDNYKGSVISTNNETSTTEINNCTFSNCHHTIYTGGNININNSKAEYDNTNNLDTDYPAFLTLYDGNAVLTNNTFNINYDTQELCSNQTNIKFAQALFSIGENAQFNNTYGYRLLNDDTLPFFENNNLSSIFARYYYPQINDCVISKAKQYYENKSCCHTIIGTDWVYKNNVEVIRGG